jgi:competence ComEA-like helix-hairpin-helix protein
VKQHFHRARIEPTVVLVLLITSLLGVGCLVREQKSITKAPPLLATGAININTATVNELQALPGIGKVIAERIVAHREQFGPFRRVEHLMMVRGVSDRKFRDIRSLIAVESPH